MLNMTYEKITQRIESLRKDLANIGGIGYGLYLWGGTGMVIGLAAWTAFKFWLLWVILGVTSVFIGFANTK